MSPQETSAEDLLRLTSKSLPDLTSSVEDVSSWTDNEDQEPDGEEEEGTGSSSVQRVVSVPLASPGHSVTMQFPQRHEYKDQRRNICSGVTESRMGQGHHAFFLFFSLNLLGTSGE